MKDPHRNRQSADRRPRDPDLAGVEAALLRAAAVARRRAAETTGTIPIFRDGKVVYQPVSRNSRRPEQEE